MPAIDLSWFETHLLCDILPHWLSSATTESGLFLPTLDRQWRRDPNGQATLVSQSRLLYNFSVGYALTEEQAYIDAVESGARYLIEHMRDREHGGFHWAFSAGGAVVDDRKDSYGHAFVVFGLSHAAACLQDDDCQAAALEAWETLSGPLTDGYGGLIPRLSADFSPDPAGAVNSQNPMMHCFEALLELSRLPGLERIEDEARRIADFVLSRRGPETGGALAEMYTEDWRPLPTSERGRVDIGHQFEWAFLLSSAAERGLGDQYLQVGRELLDYGMRVGFDTVEGGVRADASLEGEVIRPHKGCWQQCEATRAMLSYAVLHCREDLWGPAQAMLSFIQREMLDPEYGGWYGSPRLEKGSVWKLDYHVVGMCIEALRLQALLKGAR